MGPRTPNVVVLGECGRYPLFVISYSKCVKYWLKLLMMENGSLPKSAYNMLYNLCEGGKKNWVSMVKYILFRYVNQGVGDVDKFMSEFTQRVKDNFLQEWHNDIQSLPKLDHYHKYKSIFEIENYLLILDIRKYRVALSKFRCVTTS